MKNPPEKQRLRDQKYFQIALYALLVICGAILFYYMLNNFSTVQEVLRKILTVITPFLVGGAMAFVLKPFVNGLERRLEKKISNPKVLRALTVVLALLFFTVVMWAVVGVIVPKLTYSIQELGKVVIDAVDRLFVWVPQKLEGAQLPAFVTANLEAYSQHVEKVVTGAFGLATRMIPQLFGLTSSIARFVLNALLGLVVSIYLLYNKEQLAAQTKKALYAIFSDHTVEKLLRLGALTDYIFSNFVVGEIIDAVIVGLLTFASMSVFGMPYALLISVIVGVTNIIPYFGPFLGAIPSGLILLTISPTYAFGFALLILIIQQLDGNVIKPLVLGDSTGLSGLWILVSVTVGGGFFGVAGMLLGVPIFAILYACFAAWGNRRLEKKGLPVALSHYYVHPRDKKGGDPRLGGEEESFPEDEESTENKPQE